MSAYGHAPGATRWRGTLSVLIVVGASGLTACSASSSVTPPTMATLGAGPATPSGSGAADQSATATAPTVPVVVPSPGSVLATVDNIGATTVISNRAGDGFTVVHDVLGTGYTEQSTLETYDAAGNQLASLHAGQFTGDCGAANVINSAGTLVITMLITTTPAQGITPASYSLTMTAWNAEVGTPVWTADLVKNTSEQFSCPASGAGIAADMWNFISTLNGRWGVFELPPDANGNVSYDAIDLTTGKLYPNPNLEGVLGNHVVTGSGNTGNNTLTTLTVTTPGSWAPLGAATAVGKEAGDVAGLQLSGDLNEGPQNYAVTGYTGNYGTPGEGIEAVATPDGNHLVAVYSDGNDHYWYEGYSLPSLHKLWSIPIPSAENDQIVGISDAELLITRGPSSGDAYLLALDPKTGQQLWKVDIGSGSSVCELTSKQVLVQANSQLATLSAATGRQLSYEADPYTNASGEDVCPNVIETGLGGIGMGNNNQVMQLLDP